jgi:hypothetical protein
LSFEKPTVLQKLLLLFLIPASQACGQVIHSLPSSPHVGMGAYSYHFANVFSPMTNQASLANVQHAGAGVYAERKFLLKELTMLTGMIAAPTAFGCIGFVLHYFGSPAYNESQAGLAFGKKLGKIDLGIRFNYTHTQASGYGNDNAISFELGTLWHINDHLHTGLQVTNPLGGKFRRNTEEKLAAMYKWGLGYEASGKALISVEIIKEEEQPVNVLASLQYQLMDKLFTHVGVATGSGTPYFGVGYKWKSVRTTITTSYHPQLGVTPGLMLVFGK